MIAVLMTVAGFVGLVLLVPSTVPLSRPFTWGLAALLVVTGMVALERALSGRFPRWLLLLGDASYSIYLIQVFIFPVLHFGMERWLPHLVHEHAVKAGVMMILVSLVVTSVAGLVLYLLIERPMTKMLRKAMASKLTALTS
jgi:peptidoglycan/LPS O-acetylase OafA/YrhL